MCLNENFNTRVSFTKYLRSQVRASVDRSALAACRRVVVPDDGGGASVPLLSHCSFHRIHIIFVKPRTVPGWLAHGDIISASENPAVLARLWPLSTCSTKRRERMPYPMPPWSAATGTCRPTPLDARSPFKFTCFTLKLQIRPSAPL